MAGQDKSKGPSYQAGGEPGAPQVTRGEPGGTPGQAAATQAHGQLGRTGAFPFHRVSLLTGSRKSAYLQACRSKFPLQYEIVKKKKSAYLKIFRPGWRTTLPLKMLASSRGRESPHTCRLADQTFHCSTKSFRKKIRILEDFRSRLENNPSSQK